MDRQARVGLLIDAAWWILIAAMVYLVFQYLSRLLMPFALALLTAWCTRPLARALSRDTRMVRRHGQMVLTRRRMRFSRAASGVLGVLALLVPLAAGLGLLLVRTFEAAAAVLDVANRSVPWKPSLDLAEMSEGGYKVSGKEPWGVWHDSTGSFWHGKRLTVTLTGIAPVTGTLHVRFRDPNRQNRSGRGTCEGKPFDIPKHQDAKDGVFWAKLPVIREDFLDGKIELSCEVLTGPNLMIDRVVLTEDR